MIPLSSCHHMLLEPWRALAQQKHNSEHGGTFNSEIPEIPPIKKHTPASFSTWFIHFSPNLCCEMMMIHVGLLWEIESLRTILKIKRLSVRQCSSELFLRAELLNSVVSPASSRFLAWGRSDVLMVLLFKFYQKLWTTGNSQETFQRWMRQNFPSDTGNFSLWGVSVLPDFITFPKTFVCLLPRTWRSRVKTCNRCTSLPLWYEPVTVHLISLAF